MKKELKFGIWGGAVVALIAAVSALPAVVSHRGTGSEDNPTKSGGRRRNGSAEVQPVRGSGSGKQDESRSASSAATSSGGGGGGGGGLAPLSSVQVPQSVGGDIINQAAAVKLGKALFWDIQAGSDGKVACATCHFNAGADNRRLNTINPGPNGVFESGVTAAGQLFNGMSLRSDDRVGSQGVVGGTFQRISSNLSDPVDICAPDLVMPWGPNRQVTGRNAPTVIGAIFNRQNFWDGRANDVFNGVNPFGDTGNGTLAPTPTATARANDGSGKGGKGKGGGGGGEDRARTHVAVSSVASAAVAMQSTASQAVGPALSSVEMSCAGRAFNGDNSLGAKLVPRQPLQFQAVSPTDSVLGQNSNAPGYGLRCGNHLCTYRELIADAFGAAMAAAAEASFSRIWGQAIQAYEATLVPDQTPFDRYLAGDRSALTANQEHGLGTFKGKGGCTNCHSGPELTDASISFFNERGAINEDGGDQGFHNIGVRPTAEDIGRAGAGPLGVSFSESGAAADRGAFKTPGLRNVKLTAPYFHNGGMATLADVVDFYSRGGDFANPEKAKRMKPISLSPQEKAELVDFLTHGLTDCRVEKHRAPFDHPALPIPNGAGLPAVGAAGFGSCP